MRILYNKEMRGFTLIELIIVISILTIFTVLAIPNFRGYSRVLTVKENAKEIRSILWEGQSLALAPKSDDAVSYQIDFSLNDSKFTLKEKKITSAVTDVSAIELDKQVALDKIEFGDKTEINLIDISFDTGYRNEDAEQTTAGAIRFLDSSGNEIKEDKLIITLYSKISDAKYKVTVDRILNSITVSGA